MRTTRIASSFAAISAIAVILTPAVAYACSNNDKTKTIDSKPVSNTVKCLDSSDANSFVASFTRGTGTITTLDGKPLCDATDLVLESFSLPDSWDGRSFNSTAIPQTKFAETKFTFPANQSNFSKTLNVSTPDACKPTQEDFYFKQGYDKITTLHDDDARYIYGEIFKGTGSCQTPTIPSKPVETPKPTTPSTPATTTTTPVKQPAVAATVTSQPATLPNTGMGDLLVPFSVATLIGTAAAFAKQRFSR